MSTMPNKILFLLILTLVHFSKAQNTNQTDEQIELKNNCSCVQYYLCDKDNYIITTGEEIFDVRSFDPSLNRIPCSNFSEFCCKLRPGDNFSKYPQPTTEQAKVEELKCGQKIKSNSFPWLVEIFENKQNKDEYVYKCTSSLIKPNIVLTASHCVKSHGKYVVTLGNTDAYKDITSVKPSEKLLVKNKTLHPKYSSGFLYNDVALLFLDGFFNVSRKHNINTICLPSINADFTGKKCVAAGFNKKKLNNLKIVQPNIIGTETCQNQLRQTRLGNSYQLHTSFLCASGTNVDNDNCAGDGGAPLMCLENDVYVQAGIVSWGVSCGDPQVPGIYSNIPNLISWINEESEKNI